MYIIADTHDNLKNILGGRVIDGRLTPLETGVKNVVYAMGKWQWDPFNFTTDSVPSSYEKLDVESLKTVLKDYPGKVAEKMLAVANGEQYVFDKYESETMNEILYLLDKLIAEES